MAKLDFPVYDITLHEMDRVIEEENNKKNPRLYLGMSQIGDPCWRKLFYSFRMAKKRYISASGIYAIEDGFTQEDLMARRLSKITGIKIMTRDPENPTQQIEFLLLNDHFRGHCDGIIEGIKESKVQHIWEHKSVNEEKFDKLEKLRFKVGEKQALKEWDIIYHDQGQIYMRCAGLERHYLTVSTPGGRKYISIRTNHDHKYSAQIIEKAKSIIFDNRIPEKLSEKREFYLCKWCEYSGICHDNEKQDINCKSCINISIEPFGQFGCKLKNVVLQNFEVYKGCPEWICNPSLLTRTEVQTPQKQAQKVWVNKNIDPRLKDI